MLPAPIQPPILRIPSARSAAAIFPHFLSQGSHQQRVCSIQCVASVWHVSASVAGPNLIQSCAWAWHGGVREPSLQHSLHPPRMGVHASPCVRGGHVLQSELCPPPMAHLPSCQSKGVCQQRSC